MAMQMERLESFLLAEKLKFRSHEAGHIVVGFATRNYTAPSGDTPTARGSDDRFKGIAIAVRLSETGQYLECLAPGLYDLGTCRHRDVVLRALMAIMQRTKMVRFDWDPADGEIRCSVECPLEDGSLTRRQFIRMLRALPEIIDDWDPVIRAAMETGELRLDKAPATASC
jgi:hypothetical protein